MSAEPTYSAAFFAKLFNVSSRRIQQLAKDGVIPKAARNKYPLMGTVAGYVKFLQERDLESEDGKTDLYNERVRLTRANASKAEIELAETQGELISVDAVRLVWEGEAARIRSKLLVIPTKTAPRLKGKTKVAEIRDVIKEEIYETLQELSAEDDEPSSKRKRKKS